MILSKFVKNNEKKLKKTLQKLFDDFRLDHFYKRSIL